MRTPGTRGGGPITGEVGGKAGCEECVEGDCAVSTDIFAAAGLDRADESGDGIPSYAIHHSDDNDATIPTGNLREKVQLIFFDANYIPGIRAVSAYILRGWEDDVDYECSSWDCLNCTAGVST